MARISPMLLGAAAVLLGVPGLGSSAVPCDRQCLIGIADRYVDAVTHHAPSQALLAKGVRYSDQGIFVPPGDGVWRTLAPAPAQPHLYVADVDRAQVAYIGVVREGPLPALFSMRLKVENAVITEAEVFMSRDGIDTFAPENWTHVDPAMDAVLPPSERRSRKQLTAVVDGYFEGIAHATGKGVSFDPECNRFENGVQTTNLTTPNAPTFSDLSCQAQFDLGAAKFHTAVTDRRLLAVDEERGLIAMSAFLETNGSVMSFPLANGQLFTMPPARARPSASQIFEVFKIRDGKILLIHAMYDHALYGMQSGWAGGTHKHHTGDHD